MVPLPVEAVRQKVVSVIIVLMFLIWVAVLEKRT